MDISCGVFAYQQRAALRSHTPSGQAGLQATVAHHHTPVTRRKAASAETTVAEVLHPVGREGTLARGHLTPSVARAVLVVVVVQARLVVMAVMAAPGREMVPLEGQARAEAAAARAAAGRTGEVAEAAISYGVFAWQQRAALRSAIPSVQAGLQATVAHHHTPVSRY